MKGKWICNQCGKEIDYFEEYISGGSQMTKFNQDGESIEVYDQEIEYEPEIGCPHCGNTGKLIDVATWKEE